MMVEGIIARFANDARNFFVDPGAPERVQSSNCYTLPYPQCTLSRKQRADNLSAPFTTDWLPVNCPRPRMFTARNEHAGIQRCFDLIIRS